MNTLPHIAGTGALFWAALYAFNTLDNLMLGWAMVGCALTFMVLTIGAIGDDQEVIKKMKARRRRD